MDLEHHFDALHQALYDLEEHLKEEPDSAHTFAPAASAHSLLDVRYALPDDSSVQYR